MTASPPTRAFSGKRLTIVLMLVLLGTGALFYWVTTSYSLYNAARRQTDRDWRELAALLETRYRTLDQRIEQASKEQRLDPKLAEQWKAARDSFTGTSISGLQIESAEKVEAVVSNLPDTLSTSDIQTNELKQATAKYDQSATAQRKIGQSLGSRMLKILLNLPEPGQFKIQ